METIIYSAKAFSIVFKFIVSILLFIQSFKYKNDAFKFWALIGIALSISLD